MMLLTESSLRLEQGRGGAWRVNGVFERVNQYALVFLKP